MGSILSFNVPRPFYRISIYDILFYFFIFFFIASLRTLFCNIPIACFLSWSKESNQMLLKQRLDLLGTSNSERQLNSQLRSFVPNTYSSRNFTSLNQHLTLNCNFKLFVISFQLKNEGPDSAGCSVHHLPGCWRGNVLKYVRNYIIVTFTSQGF